MSKSICGITKFVYLFIFCAATSFSSSLTRVNDPESNTWRTSFWCTSLVGNSIQNIEILPEYFSGRFLLKSC